MTDKQMKNIVRTELGKIHADEDVKVQILKGLTGDIMENKENNIILEKAENTENREAMANISESKGRARVKSRGKIIAAAAAIAICVVGATSILSNLSSDVEPAETSQGADDSTAEVESVDFDGYFDASGYTVFDKFGTDSEIWQLPNGNFLIMQQYNHPMSSSGSQIYDYAIYDGSSNAIVKTMESSLINVQILQNGLVLEDYLENISFGSKTTGAEFYDFDLNLVNKFDFDSSTIESDGETAEVSFIALAQDGTAMYCAVKFTKDDGTYYSQFYEVAPDNTATLLDTDCNAYDNTEFYDIYATEDGNNLAYIASETSADSESDDVTNKQGMIETNTTEVNSFGMSDLEANLYLSFERNNKLYVFNWDDTNFWVTEWINGSEDSETSMDGAMTAKHNYTFEGEDYNKSSVTFNMSQSGDYLLCAYYKINDDGYYTDTLLKVYKMDGFEEIFSDKISGSITPTDRSFIFNEETGDMCGILTNQGEDFSDTVIYTANAFGNDYSNFGIKESSEDMQ